MPYCVMIGGLATLGAVGRSEKLRVQDAVLLLCPGPIVLVAWLLQTPQERSKIEDIVRKDAGLMAIDACRIGGVTGRWPTNLALVHAPGCHVVGEREVEGDQRAGQAMTGKRRGSFYTVGSYKAGGTPCARVYGNEVLPDWSCDAGCPVALLEAQAKNTSGRFFPQFADLADCLAWLSHLVQGM